MNKPVYYNQYNSAWADIPYPALGYESATIKTSGCGPTCFAMVHATFQDKSFTPVESCKLAQNLQDRVSGGTEDEFFQHVAAKFGYEFLETSDLSTAIKEMQNGKLVICKMQDWFKPGSGHFILAWGVSNGKIQINDPASTSYTDMLWDQSVFKQKGQRYFIFGKNGPKKDYEQIIETVSSGAAEQWKKAIETAVNAAKADGNLGDLEIFKFLPELIVKIWNSREV